MPDRCFDGVWTREDDEIYFKQTHEWERHGKCDKLSHMEVEAYRTQMFTLNLLENLSGVSYYLWKQTF